MDHEIEAMFYMPRNAEKYRHPPLDLPGWRRDWGRINLR